MNVSICTFFFRTNKPRKKRLSSHISITNSVARGINSFWIRYGQLSVLLADCRRCSAGHSSGTVVLLFLLVQRFIVCTRNGVGETATAVIVVSTIASQRISSGAGALIVPLFVFILITIVAITIFTTTTTTIIT